jgi:hypothetical protein
MYFTTLCHSKILYWFCYIQYVCSISSPHVIRFKIPIPLLLSREQKKLVILPTELGKSMIFKKYNRREHFFNMAEGVKQYTIVPTHCEGHALNTVYCIELHTWARIMNVRAVSQCSYNALREKKRGTDLNVDRWEFISLETLSAEVFVQRRHL